MGGRPILLTSKAARPLLALHEPHAEGLRLIFAVGVCADWPSQSSKQILFEDYAMRVSRCACGRARCVDWANTRLPAACFGRGESKRRRQ